MSDRSRPSIVILISGSGSNMSAIAQAIASGGVDAEVSCVISNRPNVAGLQRAEEAGIPTQVVDHKTFENREIFEKHLMRAIDEYSPDLVVLAGFMRVLGQAFVRHFSGRMLNIHPSLLPKYQGLNTHQRVIDAGDSEHGCTVHFVTEELDGGPAVIQARIPVAADDNAQSLQEKVQRKEHIVYPIAVKWFVEGRVQMSDVGVASFDGSPLPLGGVSLED